VFVDLARYTPIVALLECNHDHSLHIRKTPHRNRSPPLIWKKHPRRTRMPHMSTPFAIQQQAIPQLSLNLKFHLHLLLRITSLHKRPHNASPLTQIPLIQTEPVLCQEPKLSSPALIQVLDLMHRIWSLVARRIVLKPSSRLNIFSALTLFMRPMRTHAQSTPVLTTLGPKFMPLGGCTASEKKHNVPGWKYATCLPCSINPPRDARPASWLEPPRLVWQMDPSGRTSTLKKYDGAWSTLCSSMVETPYVVKEPGVALTVSLMVPMPRTGIGGLMA
jgi:hypothetical protein